jgi:pimeloyl-ACP methyl ester carboxylesterase
MKESVMNRNPSSRFISPRFLLIALAAVALAVIVAVRVDARSGSASKIAAAPPSEPSITWSECEDRADLWQCATLAVPIEYTQPDGPTIDLALTRLPASDPARRIGPLVLNFGGPGGPAVSTVHELGSVMFSDEIRARFDLIGFDPRGVGQSAPLDCKVDLDAYYAVDISPDTVAERQAQIDAGRRFADDCAAHGGSLLAQMGTDNVVRDLERLRLALGVERFSFWGPSYGTSIAVQYAEQYPTHVRAFSVEDVLATELDGATFTKEVIAGYEMAFNAFLADCAASPACPFHSGGNPGAAFDALMARLDETPLVAAGDPRPVTQSDLLAIVDALLWRLSTWPDMAEALALAEAGDAASLRKFADNVRGSHPDGTHDAAEGVVYGNSVYAFAAVHCLDNSFPRSLAALESVAADVATLAPRTGAFYMNLGYACVSWPAPSRPTPATPTGHGAPPLLVVGGTLDNQTPYLWAERLANQLEGAVLLTREGSGHTSYFLSRCVVQAVDAYLLELTMPAPGTVCDSTGGLFSRRDGVE